MILLVSLGKSLFNIHFKYLGLFRARSRTLAPMFWTPKLMSSSPFSHLSFPDRSAHAGFLGGLQYWLSASRSDGRSEYLSNCASSTLSVASTSLSALCAPKWHS